MRSPTLIGHVAGNFWAMHCSFEFTESESPEFGPVVHSNFAPLGESIAVRVNVHMSLRCWSESEPSVQIVMSPVQLPPPPELPLEPVPLDAPLELPPELDPPELDELQPVIAMRTKT
jgi:hypothetical protein